MHGASDVVTIVHHPSRNQPTCSIGIGIGRPGHRPTGIGRIHRPTHSSIVHPSADLGCFLTVAHQPT
jgi:hypothetical protein